MKINIKSYTRKYILAFALVLIAGFSSQLLGQDQARVKNEIDEADGNKLSISGGAQLEALALTGFVQFGIRPRLSIGMGLNFGINGTNWIVVAGENFSRKNTFNYDEEGGDANFYFETKGVSLYTNYRISRSLDVSAGYKFTSVVVDHDYNDDGGGVNGKFNGFYLQPSIGHGRIQYAFRLMIGQLTINNRSFRQPERNEFGFLIQPLILTFHFGRKKL